jgi:IS30 family transposase
MVEIKPKGDWISEKISGRLKIKEQPGTSHEWIYHNIFKDKKNRWRIAGSLTQLEARAQAIWKLHRGGVIENRRSIEERQESIGKRKRIGDWELDTVNGKKPSKSEMKTQIGSSANTFIKVG